MKENEQSLEGKEVKPMRMGYRPFIEDQHDHLRAYAEGSLGHYGVGLIIQRPRLLPMSAIAKMSGHLLIAKGESVKELEKFIRKHRDPIVSACIQWLIMEVDKL